MQIKLSRIKVEKNKVYSSKFLGEILKYGDFMKNFISF